MQKKIIALAVAGVLAAPLAAQAATAEIYGKVRLSAGIVGNDDQNAANDDSKLNLTSHNSRFGIKGSEGLNNGMEAIYQFETEVDFDDDNSAQKLFDSMRDTYLGLKGDFGKVRFGRINSPYKQASGKLDVWKDTHGDHNSIIGDTHDDRFDNSIIYTTPDMGNGFGLELGYSTDKDDDDLQVPKDGQEIVSVAASYNNGPLFLSLAVQTIDNQNGTESHDGNKLSVGYKLGMTKLGFIYENDDLGGANNDQDRMYFSVDHDMGNDMNLKFGYTMADDRGNTADTGATQLSLGVSKKMGDTIEMYALYSALENEKGTTAFDMYEGDGTWAQGSTEASADVIAVGVNMKFSSM